MMLPRFKYSIVSAFVLILLYLVLLRHDSPLEYGQHAVNVLKGSFEVEEDEAVVGVVVPIFGGESPPTKWKLEPEHPVAEDLAGEIEHYDEWMPSKTGSAEVPVVTWVPYDAFPPTVVEEVAAGKETAEEVANGVPNEVTDQTVDKETGQLTLQGQFEKEYRALQSDPSTGQIYGNTLKTIVDIGAHDGFAGAALIPTDSISPYSDRPPYVYSPYPEYNSQTWKTRNKGIYYHCNGPNDLITDLSVFSGHPRVFGEPLLGSYEVLDIDGNLCFERGERLGPYGWKEDEAKNETGRDDHHGEKRDGEVMVSWGVLQRLCVRRNAGRFERVNITEEPRAGLPNNTPKSRRHKLLSRSSATSKQKGSDISPTEREEGGGRYPNWRPDESEEIPEEVKTYGTKESEASGSDEKKVVTEANIHYNIPESGQEATQRTAILIRSYTGQKYTDNDKQNIRSIITELCLRSGGEYEVFLLVQVKDEGLLIWEDAVYHETLHANVPQEFWNWEFDSRYIGHHYNLLEKLAAFARLQPRKGLWERNERYYIPSFHGQYSKFCLDVEEVSGTDTVWGPPLSSKVIPVGPVRPVMDPKNDMYQWGKGEEADYISLAPIFNPVNTTWPGRNDVWGYDGPSDTPRRASIGTQSRCSKKLLAAMHAENLKGNHVSSEMTSQTVALLHGLKAVFAPIPVFFDRAWPDESLEKYFNPGPKGQSGSTKESPFSWGKEDRFNGSTWYYRATPPMRLYNNWLGWEDSGVGGPEWEKIHGRTCLPPVLLHPVKAVEKPPPGYSSKSDLPY